MSYQTYSASLSINDDIPFQKTGSPLFSRPPPPRPSNSIAASNLRCNHHTSIWPTMAPTTPSVINPFPTGGAANEVVHQIHANAGGNERPPHCLVSRFAPRQDGPGAEAAGCRRQQRLRVLFSNRRSHSIPHAARRCGSLTCKNLVSKSRGGATLMFFRICPTLPRW